MTKCRTYRISPNLYQFNEENGDGPYVDSYLYIGSRKAILIDALETADNLFESVRMITDLPVEVLLTHGHPDHAGKGLDAFISRGIPVYMAEEDIPVFREFSDTMPGFLPLHDGQVFSMGGRQLTVIYCAGHTPGSVVFLDRENGILFSGDSVGSGHFWMQLKHSLPLHVFRRNLARLTELTKDISPLLIFPGHRNQSPVQLDDQYLRDTLKLTGRILAGETQSGKKTMFLNGQTIVFCEAGEGMLLNMCYDPMNL